MKGERPIRVQRQRTKGWEMPPNTIYVGRPTRWANFYRVGQPMCRETILRWGHSLRDFKNLDYCCTDAADAVRRFTAVLGFDEAIWPQLKAELGGKNLACWCALDQPCHADVLLKIAND
ncbi:MAG: DUF4326 domain-containing protein [Pseudomonadota bacterium]